MFKNSYGIAAYLISYYKEKLFESLEHKEVIGGSDLNCDRISETEAQVRKLTGKWINTQSKCKQGFYPLHYASFHGNVKLIKLLVANGADISVKSKIGINMMHVAAQGD